MSKSIKADASGVIVCHDSIKGSVSGKVVKKGKGYDVVLTSTDYPLSPRRKVEIRESLRDWYTLRFGNIYDKWL